MLRAAAQRLAETRELGTCPWLCWHRTHGAQQTRTYKGWQETGNKSELGRFLRSTLRKFTGSLYCVCQQNTLNSCKAKKRQPVCAVVKAIIKLLLGADLQLAERGGQQLITNAYFHTAFLLSVLKVWHANGYSGFFFPFFPSIVFPSMIRSDLITAKSPLMMDATSSLEFF